MKFFKHTKIPLTQKQIITWLRELRGYSYNPTSHFDVTALASPTIASPKLGPEPVDIITSNDNKTGLNL